MNISLIICTYLRPKSVVDLLKSIQNQTYKPFEILIIDGSTNSDTKTAISEDEFDLNINYHLVDAQHRGLTRQRNFGVQNVNNRADIIAFLDDDLILEPNYFEQIIKTFDENPEAIGVGGIDLKENNYEPIIEGKEYSSFNYYLFDGWVKKEPLRYKARKALGLITNIQPDLIPDFSHGRSGFPPSGKTYLVHHLIGLSMNFRKSIFNSLNFDEYFQGYGLYEDFDFCVRCLSYGELYVNTNACVWHYHEPSGRPNEFLYGKMVLRNGWYVWKVRFPKNSFKAKFKWHATEILQANIRLLNVITGPNRKGALKEACGRYFGWISLWLDTPKIKS